jgi:hypothetical protein
MNQSAYLPIARYALIFRTEREGPHFAGWRDSRPVRIGNAGNRRSSSWQVGKGESTCSLA